MSIPDIRVGQGFDVHRFEVEPSGSRRLVLGGCVFEGEPRSSDTLTLMCLPMR